MLSSLAGQPTLAEWRTARAAAKSSALRVTRSLGKSRFLPLLLLATLLVGCAALEPLERPEVTVADLRLTDMTVLETSGVLVMRVANPNPEPLVVEGGAFSLWLNGIKIGKALSDQRVELDKLSTGTLEGELFLSNLALATRIRPLMESKQVDYRLQGKVYVRRTTGLRKLRVEREGSLDFNSRDASADSQAGDR